MAGGCILVSMLWMCLILSTMNNNVVYSRFGLYCAVRQPLNPYVIRLYSMKHNLHVLNKFHNEKFIPYTLPSWKKPLCFKSAQNLHSVCNSARLIQLNKLHESPRRRNININVSCSLWLLNGVLCSVLTILCCLVQVWIACLKTGASFRVLWKHISLQSNTAINGQKGVLQHLNDLFLVH